MIISVVIGTLFFISSVSCLGFLILSILKRFIEPDQPSLLLSLHRCPEAFMTGAATYTCMSFPLSVIGIPTSAWHFFGLCAGLLLWESFHPTLPEKIQASNPLKKISWIDRLPAAAFIVGAGILAVNYLLMAAFPQFDIDMIAHILIKSKVLTDSSYSNALFFRDTVFANVHTNYPPLPSFLYNLMFNLGINDITGYILTNFIIIFFITITLNSFLKECGVPSFQRSLWVIITLLTPDMVNSQFIISSIDLPLSLAILLASLALIRSINSNSLWDQTLFSLWTGIALLTKLDAIIFCGISTLILAFSRPSHLIQHLLTITLIAGPWYLFMHWLPSPADCGEDPFFKAISLNTLLSSAPAAFKTALDVVTHRWNALFLIVIPSLAILIRRTGTKWMPLILILLGLTGAYGMAMWNYIGVIDSYKNTFFRLLVHAYPLAIVLTALACTKSKHHN